MHSATQNLYDPNAVTNWLTLPFCMQEITGSNLGMETGYSDDILMNNPSHFRQICNTTLKKSMYICSMSFPIQILPFNAS